MKAEDPGGERLAQSASGGLSTVINPLGSNES